MPAFHEIRFPLALALGAVGGPERRTEIVTLASGREERNSPWAHTRRRWDAGVAIKTLDDLHTLIAFFEARRGALHGFRWRDPIDHASCLPSGTPSAVDQPLGTGDGVTRDFSLIKRYTSGAESVDRPIPKPVAGAVSVANNGQVQTEGVDFTVDATTGTVTFANAPAAGAALTAGYVFDTPVRFDAERLDVSVEAFGAGAVPRAPVIELLL